MALGAKSEEERSLRDDLAAGLKEIEEREASDTTAAPEEEEAQLAAEADANSQAAEANADRGDGRDAQGRFLPKNHADGNAEPLTANGTTIASAAEPKTVPDQQSQSQANPDPNSQSQSAPSDDPPKSWRADEQKLWAKVPPEVRPIISRREAEAARLAGANDSERMFGREFAEIVRPYMPTIQQFGVTPQQAVKRLLDSDQVLRSSTPEQKLAHARKLCLDYGIDLTQITQPDPNAPSDPFVLQLQNEIQQLKSHIGQQGQPQQFAPLPQSQEQATIQSEIEAFRADPAHPHFDAVHQVMGQLLETGAAPDLESAYQAAVVINPALRSTAAIPAPQRTQEDKTAAARRASVSVASSPGPTGQQAPLTLRDSLAEGLRGLGFSGV